MEAYIHIVHVRTRVNSENQRPIMETLKKKSDFLCTLSEIIKFANSNREQKTLIYANHSDFLERETQSIGVRLLMEQC